MTLYVDRITFRNTVSIPDLATDADIDVALGAASRAVEQVCNRRFWKDESPTQRLFTAESWRLCMIDDCADVDTVEVSRDGGATYTATTGFRTFPLNAAADSEPVLWLEANGIHFPTCTAGVRVTGSFGWPEVPAQVPQFVTILAARLLKRAREAPFGIVTAGGIEGVAMRLAREDPELHLLIGPLMRNHPMVA